MLNHYYFEFHLHALLIDTISSTVAWCVNSIKGYVKYIETTITTPHENNQCWNIPQFQSFWTNTWISLIIIWLSNEPMNRIRPSGPIGPCLTSGVSSSRGLSLLSRVWRNRHSSLLSLLPEPLAVSLLCAKALWDLHHLIHKAEKLRLSILPSPCPSPSSLLPPSPPSLSPPPLSLPSLCNPSSSPPFPSPSLALPSPSPPSSSPPLPKASAAEAGPIACEI